MKSIVRITILLTLTNFLSCKKEYVCECSDGIYNPNHVYKTKREAKKKCGKEPYYAIYDPNRKCEVK